MNTSTYRLLSKEDVIPMFMIMQFIVACRSSSMATYNTILLSIFFETRMIKETSLRFIISQAVNPCSKPASLYYYYKLLKIKSVNVLHKLNY